MKSSSQPLTINIQERNIYLAAGLGVLVLVGLSVVSSIKSKRVTQAAMTLTKQPSGQEY
jgi:hypothetical protein